MLPVAESLGMDKVQFMLPQAALDRWYPQTAFGPLEANEPDLFSALKLIDTLVEDAHARGFSDQQIAFGGFYKVRAWLLSMLPGTPGNTRG